MTEITAEFLHTKGACAPSFKWFLEQNTQDPTQLIDLALSAGRWPDILWVFQFYLNRIEAIKFAVFCAELVLDFFEKSYPHISQPKKAITFARECTANSPALAANYIAEDVIRVTRSISVAAARQAAYAAAGAARVCFAHKPGFVAVVCAAHAIYADPIILPQIITHIKNHLVVKDELDGDIR